MMALPNHAHKTELCQQLLQQAMAMELNQDIGNQNV
jgi:hypothetical protein